jgi:hypothetical protein
MPEQRVFVISGLGPRTITPRDGRPSFTVWEVFDDQGNAWRVREELYNQAVQWFGQRVFATTRTEQRGNFTNLYADSIQLASNAQPVQQAQQAQPQQQAQLHGQVQPQQQGMIVSGWDQQKQRSIHRQTAAKVAAKLSTTPAEYWENVRLVFEWFENGTTPVDRQQAPIPQRQNASAYEPFNHDPGPQEGQVESVAYGDFPQGY